MQMLEITGCSRPGMWYADKVGQRVPYEGKWPEGFFSREPAGYANLVLFEDAKVVDVAPSYPLTGPLLAKPPAPAHERLQGVVLWLPEAELLRLAEYGGYVRALPKAKPGFVPVRVVADHG